LTFAGKQIPPVMPEYADIYGLAKERTEDAVMEFLDHFLPSRIESADEYEIPQYSRTPVTVFTQASELIRHCCAHRGEVHSIYWRSDIQEEHVMVFFLADGGLVVGVSTPADNHEKVDRIALDLVRFLDDEEIIVTYEDLPPASTESFRSLYDSLPPEPNESARRSRAHRPINGEAVPADGHTPSSHGSTTEPTAPADAH
jgi:hypothetical protein